MANWSMIEDALGAIRAYPERHDQTSYFSGGKTRQVQEDRLPECGTTCCLAGWLLLRNLPVGTRICDYTYDKGGSGPAAAKIADLDIYQAELLFTAVPKTVDELALLTKELQQEETENG